MKDLIVGLILGVVLLVALGVATGHLPRKDAQFIQAVAEAKNQLVKEMDISKQEREALINAAKALNESAQKLTSVSEKTESADSHMFEDKLVEIQDQINELETALKAKSASLDAVVACNEACLNKQKAKKNCDCSCAQKSVVKPTPVKKKEQVASQPKPVICEETNEYKQCVKDGESKWDQHCSKSQEPKENFKSKMYEKTKITATQKIETNAALIELTDEKPHAICMTPRDFYKNNCKKLICK